jgi:hypothetical protein
MSPEEQAIQDAYLEQLKVEFGVYLIGLTAPVKLPPLPGEEEDNQTPEERFGHGFSLLRQARDQAMAMVKGGPT